MLQQLLSIIGCALLILHSGCKPNHKAYYSLPFESGYVDVLGEKMHYIEAGQGETILLIHGNPASAYIWRNIIPKLEKKGRVIAIDLMGHGNSAKPDIEYSYTDHSKYVNAFISEMNLKDITMVLHDWGSALGFEYAMNNPENIKGLVFFEALLAPLPGLEKWPEPSQSAFRLFRSQEGWEAIVNNNLFIEKRLQEGIVRKLTDEEMEVYRAPFSTPESRIPLYKWPNELPINGLPQNVSELQYQYLSFLETSEIPKLLLYADPGVLTPKQVVEWVSSKFAQIDTVYVGKGLHNIQEDVPEEIGAAISEWYGKL